MNRFAAFAVSLSAAALLSACVFAPPSHSSNAYDASALEKNSERALTACGAGNVKEVNAKGFSCK
jgi:outer membrane biogenesis lipoprotein LolB